MTDDLFAFFRELAVYAAERALDSPFQNGYRCDCRVCQEAHDVIRRLGRA